MDPKARQILIDTYWSSTGWKPAVSVSPEDFQYAKSKSVMFDELNITHDKLIAKTKEVFNKTDKQKVAKNFLASLSTRNLEMRSAISSYVVARTLPLHVADPASGQCSTCGCYAEIKCDFSIMNFERVFFGGVRLADPAYVYLDLMLNTKVPDTEPTPEDIDIFKKTLIKIKMLPPGGTPNDLESQLTRIVPSNKDERRVLINILGVIGVLETKTYRGYHHDFVTVETVNANHKGGKNDWCYPVMWWRGKDGINREVLDFYFSDFVSM